MLVSGHTWGDGREARIEWGIDARIKGVGAAWTGGKCAALQGKQASGGRNFMSNLVSGCYGEMTWHELGARAQSTCKESKTVAADRELEALLGPWAAAG